MRRLQNSDTADVDVLKVGENHARANHGQNCRASAFQLALRCFYLLRMSILSTHATCATFSRSIAMAWWYIGLICSFPTLKLPLDFCRAGITLGRSSSSSDT